jgi:pimeloyl-ACP methyl ester carboxylesterase
MILLALLAATAVAAEGVDGTVISKDGTTIAFDRLSASEEAPVVILVGGALSDRSAHARLAVELSKHLTVVNYDRRGRGLSGDTQPYAVEREVEDLEALIDSVGGKAALFGASSGAVLALEAAHRLPAKVTKLVAFEPPFILDDSRPPMPADFLERARTLLAEEKRGEAVEMFLTEAVLVPAEFVAQMKKQPMWASMEKLAHTLPYDGAVMGDTQSGKPLPADRWKSATMPALLLSGGASPPWLQAGARSLAALLPDAEHRTLAGLDHSAAVMKPQELAPVLAEFLAD